jgi:hypothetical protein
MAKADLPTDLQLILAVNENTEGAGRLGARGLLIS